MTETNKGVLLRCAARVGLVASVTLLVAGPEPARLLRVLFSCSFATALVCVALAVKLREPVLAPGQLTHWDEAIAFFLLTHLARQLSWWGA